MANLYDYIPRIEDIVKDYVKDYPEFQDTYEVYHNSKYDFYGNKEEWTDLIWVDLTDRDTYYENDSDAEFLISSLEDIGDLVVKQFNSLDYSINSHESYDGTPGLFYYLSIYDTDSIYAEEDRKSKLVEYDDTEIKDGLYDIMYDYMTNTLMMDDADEWLSVTVKDDTDYNCLRIQISAELSYEEFSDVIDEYLNPFIQQYDKEAYFEHYTSGIIVSTIWWED